MNLVAQLVGVGVGLPCPFWKYEKIALILEKIALFVCIYGLNCHLKCSFKDILEKKHEQFFLRSLKCLSNCRYFKKPILPCAPITLVLTFHPNFNPNICTFSNLLIYRKSTHDNISLVFWKSRIYCLVLFWRRYKIVCTYGYLH